MVGEVGVGGVGGEGVSANTPLFQRPIVGKPTIFPGVKFADDDSSATATGIINLAYPGTVLSAVLSKWSACFGVSGVSVVDPSARDWRSVEREYCWDVGST